MNALFQNLNIISSSNLLKKFQNLNIKNYYLFTKINNNQNQNQIDINYQQKYNLFLNKEKINQLAQNLNDLDLLYIKERQNKIIINDDTKYSLNENKNMNNQELNNDKKIFDSLSEVKKFKTELCHSWELTGTCKYGLNVS